MIPLTWPKIIWMIYLITLAAIAFGKWRKVPEAGLFVWFLGIGILLLTVSPR